MNIEQAVTIEGGMNPIELEWLAVQANKSRVVVEIGSLRGRSARAMADNMRDDSLLFCVDHFKGSEEHGDAFSRDYNLYKTFFFNMMDHIVSGRVHVICCPSVDAAEIVKRMVGSTLDMVFIDASHDYDNVMADIQTWRTLLRPEGLLSGHDYGHPPIERAVEELFGRLPTVAGGSIWYTVIE
jgi:predicted O-methyltransferase YrrM